MLKITPEEKTALKGRGFILTNDGEHFIARIVPNSAFIPTGSLQKIVEAADKYGNGEIALTSRMTLEVQGISYENIEPFNEAVLAAGYTTGGTGGKVRPVVCCKGSVCVHGLVDTKALSEEIHQKFYIGWHEVRLPHKFKIGIGGCPNNCIKPQLNDFGIFGQKVPKYDPDDCNGCKKCSVIEVCPMNACSIDDDGIMQIDKNLCNNCGKCVNACNFDCIEVEKEGFAVTLGGIWGKTQRIGTRVPGVFTHDELISIIEKCILLYREQGKTGERFGRSVDRIGVENFIQQLLSDDVLARKQEILDAQLHLTGGAKC